MLIMVMLICAFLSDDSTRWLALLIGREKS
jgi:hypothetical protein